MIWNQCLSVHALVTKGVNQIQVLTTGFTLKEQKMMHILLHLKVIALTVI